MTDAEILIVNLTKSDDIDQAKAIIDELNLGDLAYYDLQGHVQNNYDIIATPASIYISPEGYIKLTTFGPDTPEGILEKIKK